MKELMGKTIEAIFVGEGEHEITFKTDTGYLTYIADGDCCSETWFADILGVSALIGGTVTSVEEAEIVHDDDGSRTRQEYDKVYGFKITTNKGYADIAFRNSSNGYYGGWIDGVTHDAPSTNAQPITEDWSA